MKRVLLLIVLGVAFVAAFLASTQILSWNPEPTPPVGYDFGYCNSVLELVTTGWEHPGGEQPFLNDPVMIADCIEKARVPAAIGLSIALAGCLVGVAWSVVFIRGRQVRSEPGR